MANLISRRPHIRAATRGLRAGPRAAHRLRARQRGRAGDMGARKARIATLLAACGAGAAAEYFVIDRQHGARRRHMVRERGRAALRRRSRNAVRRAKYLEGVAEGVAHKAAHAVPGVGARKEPPDDTTLAQKVESIAFRRAGVSKGHVSVNAEGGVIYLRGRLERDEQIEELVRTIHAIEGVKGVNNLLHARTTTTERA